MCAYIVTLKQNASPALSVLPSVLGSSWYVHGFLVPIE
jgi:hypothetical protein